MLKLIIRCLLISVLFALPVAAAFAVGLIELDRQTASSATSGALLIGVIVLVSTFAGSLIASLWNARSVPVAAGQTAAHRTGTHQGTVKWFNVSKGFGFITGDDGGDVFVHFRDIRGKGHRSLNAGQRVAFEVRNTEKGPQAQDVAVLAES